MSDKRRVLINALWNVDWLPHLRRIETASFLAWCDLPLALLLGLISLLACNTAGWLLHLCLRRRGHPPFGFQHSFSGMILLVSVFAIWITRGRTLLLPAPLLIAGAILSERTSLPRRSGEWLAGVLGLGGFLLFYAQAFSQNAAFLKFPSGDLAYYARLADHLLLNGQENRLVDIPAPVLPVAQLYHWGDVWGLAMITKLWGLRAVYALPLIVFPALAGLFCMGLFRILRAGKVISVLPALLVALILPFSPPLALLPDAWTTTFHLLPAPVAQYPKLLMYGIVLCAVLEQVRNRQLITAVWLLVLGGVFHASMLPAGIGGIAAILVLLWRRSVDTGKSWIAVALLIALCVWMAVFYLGMSGPVPFSPAVESRFGLHPGILLPALANLAMLLPYVLLLLIARRSNGPLHADLRAMFYGLGILLLAGLSGWTGSADVSADSAQFFTATIPLAATLGLAVLIPVLAAARRRVLLAIALLLPLGGAVINLEFSRRTYLTDRISRDDYGRLQSIPAIARPYDSLKAVVIKSPQEPDRLATRYSVVFYPLEFLAFEHPQYMAASLQAPFLSDVPEGAPNAVESAGMKWHTPVMQFVDRSGLKAVPPELQAYWYVERTRPDILIIANDAVVPDRLRYFLGADSVQLQSKPYRVLSLEYRR